MWQVVTLEISFLIRNWRVDPDKMTSSQLQGVETAMKNYDDDSSLRKQVGKIDYCSLCVKVYASYQMLL